MPFRTDPTANWRPEKWRKCIFQVSLVFDKQISLRHLANRNDTHLLMNYSNPVKSYMPEEFF